MDIRAMGKNKLDRQNDQKFLVYNFLCYEIIHYIMNHLNCDKILFDFYN